ncbi:MAG: ABC transporter substrate-binding protein [bacterium]|nr:ABC transporter substrate-binding protein [bacterium]
MDELPQEKKSFVRRELIYLLAVLIAAVILGVLVILRLNPQATKLQGADYIEGLPKDQVRIGVDSITGLYPNIPFANEILALNNGIFEGLTVIRQGRVQPALAQSWTNPDNLTWRIKLRSNVKFHSGQTLKASDVRYTIEEAKEDYFSKNPIWVTGFVAARVDSVKVIDDSTVELKTAIPDPTLMHWMVFLFILSEEQVKKDGLDKATGTGPYKVASFSKEEAVLEANTGYWGGVPKVKKLIYKAFKDEESLVKGLEDGKIDISFVIEKVFDESIKNKGLRIIPASNSGVGYIGFDATSIKAKYVNTEKNPFADVKVRKAILLALDAEKLLKDAGSENAALSQFATEDLVGFNSQLKRPVANQIEAKKLLSEAGFPDGFEVTLDTADFAKKIPEQIKLQLAEVGIMVKLNVVAESEDFYNKLFSGDTSFYYLNYVPDTIDSTDLLNSFIHTVDKKTGKGSNNMTAYSNEKIDKLLDRASAEFDSRERANIISKVHAEVMDELPLVPIDKTTVFFIVRDDVSFKPAPFGFIFGYELSGRQKVTEDQK